jgi:enterochelin esterase-like enzyme
MVKHAYMNLDSTILRCLALISLGFSAAAQPATPSPAPRRPRAPVYSPEIHADRSVTFRIRAPDAREITVGGEWGGQPLKLTQNEEGIWSVTTPPLTPELYGYEFTVDKLRVADPGNPNVKPMRAPVTSILEIPGTPPLIHELRDVPHGAITIHPYYARELKAWRRVHVYTPPGYQKSGSDYPTLYLFHGSGDNDATWSVLGRANVIIDNLLAEKKVRPMIIVMPDGHPLAGRITGAPGPDVMQRNVESFANDVLREMIPLIEKEYRVGKTPEKRAVAGLSMGGGQSIHIGLNHPELFGYVAGFSSYVADPEKVSFKVFDDGKPKPLLIWTACGKEDRLLENARQLSENLTKHSIKHEFLTTEGNHSWPVWRKHLAQLAPLLFTK